MLTANRKGVTHVEAEAIKIILTAGAFELSKQSHPFNDTDSWQNLYVAEALDRQIIESGTELKPNTAVTRAEAARLTTLMLHNYEAEVE